MDTVKKQTVLDAIYRVRWVDAFGKDGEIATDERIAEAVLEAIGKENSGIWPETE